MPKKIWTAWFQGWDDAPDIVKMNLTRWATLNPGWEVELLDLADAEELLAGTDVVIDALTPMALSDIVRLKLLTDLGGVWVDATLYPCWPLDAWLPQVLDEGFFLFKNGQQPDAVPNWFLASEPGHLISARWWADTERLWSRPRRPLGFREEWPDDVPWTPAEPDSDAGLVSYLWTMDLFHRRRRTDPEFAAVEARIPLVEEDLMWLMAGLIVSSQDTVEALAEICAHTPVQKLGWRGTGWPVAALATLGIGTP